MRRAKLATVLLVCAQVWVYSGCSSAETPAGGDPSTGGTGASGGSGGTGGTTGGTGGTTGGTGGTSSGSGGTSGTANTDPNCKGIKTNMACPNEGLHCDNLVCGLGDSGTRVCDCATNWSCTACDFSASPFDWAKSKPADITPCTGAEQDTVPCATLGATCEGAANGEACVCFLDDESAQIWDCDKPPSTWAM